MKKINLQVRKIISVINFRLQKKPVVIKIFEILCFMICTFRFRIDPEPLNSAVEPDPDSMGSLDLDPDPGGQK
jgi:hypothetical protein